MNYLLDTNVVSELIKPAPAPQVWAWVDAIPDGYLFISALTIGEIQRGLEQLPPSERRACYELWFHQSILERYAEHILAIDTAVMLRWGTLVARLQANGRGLPAFDSLLAATALTHDLRLVTRNTRDFADTGVHLINPWLTTSPPR